MGLLVSPLIWLVNKKLRCFDLFFRESINQHAFISSSSVGTSNCRVSSFTNTREICSMEGERRKRKLENEESEEEKMEKFFSLIRSTKVVRDRLAKEKQEDYNKKVEGEKGKGIWKPTFQAEDFLDFHISSSTTPPAGTSNTQVTVVEEKKQPEAATTETPTPAVAAAEAAAVAQPQMNSSDKEKENDNLDLTLSL